ncbi:MAG: FkbM family methyltransferase [Syntrophales bacterium]|nr:FkbM family methyltransferase [Syntrophales bacterium]
MKKILKKPIRSILGFFPRITFTLLTISDAIDRFQKPIPTRWGFILSGHRQMAEGNFEPIETEMVRNLAQNIDLFVNIGANVGYFCCHVLSLGKPVIAVEPNFCNLWYLMKNIKDNGWAKQAEIFPLAVGEGPDILKIYGWGTGASLIKGWQKMPESFAGLTPTISLDRLLCNKLKGKKALIMADIEGAEYIMLKGASATLSNNPPPLWIVEIHGEELQPKGVKFNPHFRKTFEIFFQHGYRCLTVERETKEVTIQTILAIERRDFKLNTHNFFFRKD